MDIICQALSQKCAQLTDRQAVWRAIVDTPFKHQVEAAELSLGIVVLLLVDKPKGLINRVALSDTDFAKSTTQVSAKPFEDIKIPLSHPRNLIARAIRTQRPLATADWYYLFTPELSPEAARLNQAAGAIAFSSVYPLPGQLGALIFSYYQDPNNIGKPQTEFMQAYSALVGTILKRDL